MSDFHGGFLLTRLEGTNESSLVAAVRRYLGSSVGGHHITVAARQGSPVVHVAVRGGDADGKGYCYWHAENWALGAEIARALGTKLWAYWFENQSGYEATVEFDATGTEQGRYDIGWDELADQLDLPHDDDGHRELMRALPLGCLAAELGVERNLLEYTLGYETPICELRFDGSTEGALATYLSEGVHPLPPRDMVEQGANLGLYFPGILAQDLADLAGNWGVSLGTVFWAAWETGKAEVFRTTPGYGDGLDDAPPMQPPPSVWPPMLQIPKEAPPAPIPDSPHPAGVDKQLVKLVVPEHVAEEIRTLAVFADRSMSWCAQKAISAARDRLHAATLRS